VTCKGGKHRWNEEPAQAGSFCLECGHVHTGKGRKKGSRNGNKETTPDTSTLSAIAGELVGYAPDDDRGSDSQLGSDAASDVESVVVGTGDTTISAPTPRWCATAGRRLARVFVDGVEWANERFRRRRANEPDDEDVKEFGEALGESLGQWFPDSELTPGKKALIAGLAIGATMSIGAKKIEPARPAQSATSNAAPQPVAHSAGERPISRGGEIRIPSAMASEEYF